jgi:hypothetical protein
MRSIWKEGKAAVARPGRTLVYDFGFLGFGLSWFASAVLSDISISERIASLRNARLTPTPPTPNETLRSGPCFGRKVRQWLGFTRLLMGAFRARNCVAPVDTTLPLLPSRINYLANAIGRDEKLGRGRVEILSVYLGLAARTKRWAFSAKPSFFADFSFRMNP